MAEADNRKHFVRAAYAPDRPGADNMIRILKDNGIDSFRQGGVKDIYKPGGDIFGEEIMVSQEDLPRAIELLNGYKGVSVSSSAPRKASVKKTVLSFLAAAVLLFVLLFIRGRFFA